jgi:hypothetical protein
MKKKILLEALITEREGMLAENTHRLDCGHSIAYTEEAFQTLADKMREILRNEDEAYQNWIQYRRVQLNDPNFKEI